MKNILIPVGAGLPKVSEHWLQTKDGDAAARELFDRHYSRYFYADGRKPKLFVGPGGKMVLLSLDGDALFVWRKFISKEAGVNCAIFRNEGTIRSSSLILEAEQLAWARWPGERLFTYVNPAKVRSTNPGACFKMAGWRVCGITKKRRYLILEKLPK